MATPWDWEERRFTERKDGGKLHGSVDSFARRRGAMFLCRLKLLPWAFRRVMLLMSGTPARTDLASIEVRCGHQRGLGGLSDEAVAGLSGGWTSASTRPREPPPPPISGCETAGE